MMFCWEISSFVQMARELLSRCQKLIMLTLAIRDPPARRDCEATMRAVLLSLLLLCAVLIPGMVCSELKAVKLCGREFIRAVVYTCGGSRWKRIFDEAQPDGISSDEHSSLENLSFSPEMTRTRRDLNQVLTTVCCQVGCRKSDLTFLC
ncbi:relaxin-3-like [Arapaima gigas]